MGMTGGKTEGIFFDKSTDFKKLRGKLPGSRTHKKVFLESVYDTRGENGSTEFYPEATIVKKIENRKGYNKYSDTSKIMADDSQDI
jgi:hypothetical protein